MENLPSEILLDIFSYLDHTEKVKLMRTCRLWQQCLQSTSIYKYNDFDYAARICDIDQTACDWLGIDTRRGAYDTLEREISRYDGKTKEMVVPPQTDYSSYLVHNIMLQHAHGSNLVKIDIGGRLSQTIPRTSIVGLVCSETLEVLRLKDCDFMLFAWQGHTLPRLQELRLSGCHVVMDMPFPSSLNTLRITDTVLPISEDIQWPDSKVPELHSLELGGHSLTDETVSRFGRILETQASIHARRKTPAPTLNLTIINSPSESKHDAKRIMGILAEACAARLKSLKWDVHTDDDSLLALLYRSPVLENLDIGGSTRLTVFFLEFSNGFPPSLRTMSVNRARSQLKDRDLLKNVKTIRKLRNKGIELGLWKQAVVSAETNKLRLKDELRQARAEVASIDRFAALDTEFWGLL